MTNNFVKYYYMVIRMKADIVCEGGGIKGIALIGALVYLEEQGFEWDELAGTSAGAIATSLLAVGYKAKELKEIFFNLDIESFKDKDSIHRVPYVGKIFDFVKDKGLYSGDNIENLLRDKFRAKGKTKFKDISINGASKLKVIAADVIKREIVILPDDLVKYNIDPMEFEIAKAVRMSLSIPFFYDPVRLEYDNKYSLIVDGGVLSNFPIWLFDVEEEPKWPTFGLRLTPDYIGESINKKTNILSYALSLIDTMLSKNEEIYLKDKDAIRTIKIPTVGISVIEFDITNEQKQNLYESGYNSAKAFLDTWDFNSYIEKYRKNQE